MSKFTSSILFALMAGSAIASPVIAQQTPVTTEEKQPDTAGQLQDIVVTAQRRDERLQDVPISITALGGESLKIAGVTGTDSLAMAVPGLEMAAQQTSISPFVRGLGNRSTTPGDEAAVPIYVDGVYMANLAASVFSLASVERVEVLEGPQGTLFGRNAAAGAIQIVTRRPSHDPSAEMSLSYGNYNTVTGQFYGTAGITNNLAADLSVYAMNQAMAGARTCFPAKTSSRATRSPCAPNGCLRLVPAPK